MEFLVKGSTGQFSRGLTRNFVKGSRASFIQVGWCWVLLGSAEFFCVLLAGSSGLCWVLVGFYFLMVLEGFWCSFEGVMGELWKGFGGFG